jgi:hypothetical protein
MGMNLQPPVQFYFTARKFSIINCIGNKENLLLFDVLKKSGNFLLIISNSWQNFTNGAGGRLTLYIKNE